MTPNRHPTVSFAGLKRRYHVERPILLAAIAAALDTGCALDGPQIDELERRCADLTGRHHARAVNSGTDGLVLALRSANIGPGNEVIVTAFSFIASASAIRLVGATPVFVDIDPQTYLMDLTALPKALTPATKAIIAVDLFGQCLPPLPLESFAAEHGLVLIEDAAQALGASINGRPAGSLGHLSVLSFDPFKVVSGVTSGGLVLTDDPDLDQSVRRLRCHGFNPMTGQADTLGINSRMPTLNAAVLLSELDHASLRGLARARTAAAYRSELADLWSGVLPVACPANAEHNHHKFVLRSAARDHLRDHLAACGIETKIHYRAALPDQPAFAGTCRTIGCLPHARQAAQEVLSLPIHSHLTDTEVDHVITCLRRWRP
jgi:dTDP-4-amino-4,6-dideoxygalactose transaminase